MTKKEETRFKDKVLFFIKRLPHTWYVVNDHRSIRGIPDITLCIAGLFVALELKKDWMSAHRASPRARLQKWNLEMIAKAGGMGYLVFPENWKQIQELLLEVSEGAHYDHIDIRTNTQSKFYQGITKAVQPRKLRFKAGLPRGKDNGQDPKV